MKFFLASQSPQRRKLLAALGVRFTVVRAPYVERVSRKDGPSHNAMRLAKGKARAAIVRGSGVVIAADTLVYFEGKILGKPRDSAHARRMLRSFSGKPQWIYTGVALREVPHGRMKVFAVKSKVVFRRMEEHDVEKYLKTGEYRGKAGAFGLQGKGAHLIRRVSGSRSNVIGLPLERLRKELKKLCHSRECGNRG